MKIQVCVVILMLGLFCLPIVESTASESKSTAGEIPFDYITPALQMINMTEIQEHVNTLSSFGTRFTGYQGNEKAAEYIIGHLNAIGLRKIELHPFKVLVPVNEGAYLRLSTGENITLYPFMPNVVCPPQTPPGGIEGELIDLGQGELSDYDGHSIEGSIVMIDFNVQYRWLKAIKYGAKAVIFTEPADSNYNEAYTKILHHVAVNIPRFLIKAQDVADLRGLLKKGSLRVGLTSNVKWRTVESKNIIAFLPGQGNIRSEYILLTAHYDSFSWIPDISPGAREAVGASILLSLAEYYSSHPMARRYTLVFIFFSGTDQGVYGSRSFVNDYIDNATKFEEWTKDVVLQMNFDITGVNRIVMPSTVTGWLVPWEEGVAPWIGELYTWVKGTVLPDMASKMKKPQLLKDVSLGPNALVIQEFNDELFGPTGAGFGKPWADLLGFPKRYSDSEPLQNVGGPAFSWWEFFNEEKYWGTIFDTKDKIRYDNVRAQLETIYPIVNLIVQTDLRGVQMLRKWTPGSSKGNWPNRINAAGTIMQYDPIEGWYIPVPNAIVAIAKAARVYYGYPETFNRGQGWIYTLSNEKGQVLIPNILGMGGRSYDVGAYHFRAYVVDPETGNPIMAPALGTYWYPGNPIRTTGNSNVGSVMFFSQEKLVNEFGTYVIFNCSNIVIFDLGDVYLRGGAFDASVKIEVNNFLSHVIPEQFSYDIFIERNGEGIAALFVPPDEPLEILQRVSYIQRLAETVLNNASETKPQGSGYTLKRGEKLTIYHTALTAATNWHFIIKERVNLLESKGISLTIDIAQLGNLLDSAWRALKEHSYTRLDGIQNRILILEFEAYIGSRALMEDTIGTITFFGLLLVPFALLAERLFGQRLGLQRVIVTVLCFILPVAFLNSFHPGFSLASNSMMVLIGFVVLVLTMPVIAILFTNSAEAIKRIRTKVFGTHWVEVTRTAAFLLSFSTGILNMRKRPIRTTLMLVSIILVTTGMVMFTSVSEMAFFRIREMPDAVASYDGLLVHQWHYSEDLSGASGDLSQSGPQVGNRFLDELTARYGDKAIIIPRCWQYIGSTTRGVRVMTPNASIAYNVPIIALLGLTPEEDSITKLSLVLAQGTGSRWFIPEDEGRYRAIISEEMAKALDLSVGKSFILGSYDFTVVGVISSRFDTGIVDLDQIGLAPIDTRIAGFESNILSREIIILPYRTLLSAIGDRPSSIVASVALKMKPEYTSVETLSEMARDLCLESGMRMPIWFSLKGKVYILDRTAMVNVYGWESQYAPLTIASMAILGLLLGAIEERRRDIFVYSSVGLSPFHVAFLFLAEVVTYALLGGIFGCMTGMVMAAMGTSIFSGELFLNFASSKVVTTVSVVMAAITAAAVYPIRHASRLVTPSLERRWKLSRPKGDEWTVTLPMSTVFQEEADGFLAFINEFLQAHRVEGAELFRVNTPVAFSEETTDLHLIRKLSVDVSLAPYEHGVGQSFSIIDNKEMRSGRHAYELFIQRRSGAMGTWITLNRPFIDSLRKQIFLWRSFGSAERERYRRMFEETALKGR